MINHLQKICTKQARTTGESVLFREYRYPLYSTQELVWKNDDFSFSNYPMVGYQNKLQASGWCRQSEDNALLLTACPRDPRIHSEFFQQTTFGIALSKSKDFVLDVKKFRDMLPTNLCGVDFYSGFLMRYVKASNANLIYYYLNQNNSTLYVSSITISRFTKTLLKNASSSSQRGVRKKWPKT